MIKIADLKQEILRRQEWYWKQMTVSGSDMRSYYHGAARAYLGVIELVWAMEAQDAHAGKDEDEDNDDTDE